MKLPELLYCRAMEWQLGPVANRQIAAVTARAVQDHVTRTAARTALRIHIAGSMHIREMFR